MTRLTFAEFFGCCACADGDSGQSALAACAARHWLARNAAAVKTFTCSFEYEFVYTNIPTYVSLVSCLPALETVDLCLPEATAPNESGCLLKALSRLPRLRTLVLSHEDPGCGQAEDYDEGYESNSSAEEADTSDFATLRSLTKLALSFNEADACSMYFTCSVANVVTALVSLTGLAVLDLGLPGANVVPAALGQLKGLRSLEFSSLHPCDFEAGCLKLPNLMSLRFFCCDFVGADMPLGVTALQNLTSITFSFCRGPRFFDHQLVRLPRLQRIDFSPGYRVYEGGASSWLFELPADMGTLRSSLLQLNCSAASLAQFPCALAQLAALEHLDASNSTFADLPAAITALLKLTQLVLGRSDCCNAKQPHHKRPLDARALGDLSAFPALCRLAFSFCEVTLCESMLGAVRHASLTSMAFITSHPAPKCALMVMQLSQALRRSGRGGVLSFERDEIEGSDTEHAIQSAHALPPLHKFLVALQAYGM